MGRTSAIATAISIPAVPVRAGEAAAPWGAKRLLESLREAGVASARIGEVAPTDCRARPVEILIEGSRLDRARTLLAGLGFREVGARAGELEAAALDAVSGTWSTVRLVTEITLGRGGPALRSASVSEILGRRPGRLLAPEDEAAILLLRAVDARGTVDHDTLTILRGRLREDADLREHARARLSGWLHVDGWAELMTALERAEADSLLAWRREVERRRAEEHPLEVALAKLDRTGRRVRRHFGKSPRGLVIALMGPDGAGKTTLADALTAEAPLRARRIYMGSNLAAGDTLPSTAWMRRREAEAGRWPVPARWVVRVLAAANRYLEQQLRNAAALHHRRRGGVVVYDRYFLDRATRPDRSPSRGRLRRRLKELGAPRPDLVVVLDAPGAVLHDRKGEHDPHRLEIMRAAYLDLRSRVPGLVVLDANRPADSVRRDLVSLVSSRLREPPGTRNRR